VTTNRGTGATVEIEEKAKAILTVVKEKEILEDLTIIEEQVKVGNRVKDPAVREMVGGVCATVVSN
jgi:hypothetical protein